ncbi:MAG TPA: bacteriohemerythrin [Rhodospirillaceae bacterium]|nr:bacteriohemerythrin [Rhodospirillaceae bacterium]
MSGGKLSYVWRLFTRGVGLKTILACIPPSAVAWVFFVLYLRSVLQTHADDFILTLSLGLLGIAAGSVIVVWLVFSIAPPLRQITEATHRLEAGNTDFEVPYRGRRDEIGELADALQVFKQTAIDKQRLEAERVAEKERSEAERKQALNRMASAFETEVGSVVDTVSRAANDLQGASRRLTGTAEQTCVKATNVAEAAEQASGNVQTVAMATDALAGSINDIAQQVERSRQVAAKADQEANGTAKLIERLSENVSSISEIVALINAIASQTNLLALNATIEAARAGDAGKGFAVVANEVKGLANQTAKATEQISAQINAVQSGTSDAVQAIESISKVIHEMNSISSSVALAVQQQTTATHDITLSVGSASQSTQEVASNIEQVELASRDTGSAASEISGSADQLSQQADVLKREVANFLKQVRADKENMQLMQWDSALEIGHAEIDHHHQALFQQMNSFFGKMAYGEGESAATEMMALLTGSLDKHFRDEEALMQRIGFPNLDRHRSIHAAFLAQIRQMTGRVQANEPGMVNILFDLCSRWVDQHIRKEDREIALFARENRAS